MEWMKRLNQSIEYIEQHITEELDYEKVAEVAGCPSYYFQQMFLYMTDMTLREYIRRRRLSLAAVELQKDTGRVIDIAVKYGYESPTAFTRAFKSFHGIVPSVLKTENVSLQAFPPIQFHVSMDGGQPLKFRLWVFPLRWIGISLVILRQFLRCGIKRLRMERWISLIPS